ncbi:MAG: drug resistance transporter, EmrB/QacA subfamily [Mycobacterium sp.]|nr:drug resistance transporter, EmrB/QacA subfamily [Mycobacterium sp.]
MRKWSPLIAICLGTFMLLVDVTIVNVALPSMTQDLRTSFSSLQWVVDAYALALAALLMGIGSMADIIGHRRAYIGGLLLFATASLACGLAPNAGFLIGARAVQGVGAAAMFATTFALINSSYEGRDRGTAYGMWGAVSGASAAVGPIVGGLLTQGLNWRWIFFVNLPVSVAAIALSLRVLSGDRPTTGRRVDVPGAAAFTVAAGALVFAMIRASKDGWISGSVLSLLALGIAALAVFALIQSRVEHPLLDLALLRNRTFSGILIAALLFNFAAFACFTYTSIWLQTLIDLSPIEAGLTGLPLSAGAFVVSAALGRHLGKYSPRPVIASGLLLIGVGALISAVLVHSGSSWPALMAGFLVCGLGVGLAVSILSSTGVAAVAPDRAGMAGGAINTARQLGYAFGIAALGTIFTSQASDTLADRGVAGAPEVASTLASGGSNAIIGGSPSAVRGQVSANLHAAFASGLDGAFTAAGIAGLIGALAAWILVRPVKPHWEAAQSSAQGSVDAKQAPVAAS